MTGFLGKSVLPSGADIVRLPGHVRKVPASRHSARDVPMSAKCEPIARGPYFTHHSRCVQRFRQPCRRGLAIFRSFPTSRSANASLSGAPQQCARTRQNPRHAKPSRWSSHVVSFETDRIRNYKKREIAEADQRDLGRPVPFAKRFLFSLHPNQLHMLAIPSRQRGVSRSSRTLGAGCGGRGSVGRAIGIAGRVAPRER